MVLYQAGDPCRHAERYGNRYFMLFSENRTYLEAQDKCLDMDGHLASVHNEAENNFLKEYIRHTGLVVLLLITPFTSLSLKAFKCRYM